MGHKHEVFPELHISVLIICFGIFLAIIKAFIDGEPGALPLIMIAIGAVWYYINRKQRKNREQNP